MIGIFLKKGGIQCPHRVRDTYIVVRQLHKMAHRKSRTIGVENSRIILPDDMAAGQAGKAQFVAVGGISHFAALGEIEIEANAMLHFLIEVRARIFQRKTLRIAYLGRGADALHIAAKVIVRQGKPEVGTLRIAVHLLPPHIEVAVGQLEQRLGDEVPALFQVDVPVYRICRNMILGDAHRGKKRGVDQPEPVLFNKRRG